MRILVVVLVVVSHAAFAAPSTCPAGEKRFKCHQLALQAHLRGDVTTARALYRDACDRGEAASCNNLGVLAVTHPEVAAGIDPKALFDKACDRLEHAACDNARRFATTPDLSVELSLGDTELTIGADAWHRLVADACKAGDVSRCEEATQRARMASLLADECRAGTPASCVDAAAQTTDDAKAATLLALGCKGKDGRACHALAARKGSVELYKGSCIDTDWTVSTEDIEARTDDCVHWAKAAHGADRRRAADLAADACNGCLAAAEAYDAVGESAKAFALADKLCTEMSQSDACRDVGERLVLGKGTHADIAKGFEQLGNTCPDGLAWSTCKKIGQWLVAHTQAAEAGKAFDSACKGGNQEACYLQARAYEAVPHRGCPGIPGLDTLATTYDELCKQGDRAACGARPRLCTRAMAEYEQPRECGYGIGDGSVHRDLVDWAVLELCPKTSWTPAVRKGMKAYDEACHQAHEFNADCDP